MKEDQEQKQYNRFREMGVEHVNYVKSHNIAPKLALDLKRNYEIAYRGIIKDKEKSFTEKGDSRRL